MNMGNRLVYRYMNDILRKRSEVEEKRRKRREKEEEKEKKGERKGKKPKERKQNKKKNRIRMRRARGNITYIISQMNPLSEI